MRTRIVLTLYALWMLGLTAAFYAFPSGHLILWSSLALSSAGAIAVGVLMHRPTHAAPWWLLMVGVTVFAAGDTTYNILTTLLGQENPFPSLADVFYLAMYPIIAAGLLLLVRHRTGGRDSDSLLDALSPTAALALLSWIFLIDPYVQNADLTFLERATSIAYPLGDVLILATLARLLITTGRNPAAVLLGVGTAGLLVSDVLYGFVQLGGSWQIGSSYDLGWVIFYLAWGAAALHPSMAGLTVPAYRPSGEMSLGRISLLMAVSLVPPGALLADAATNGVQHAPIIAMFSAVLFLLVLLRLSGVVKRHKQAIERERTLRSAGAALVSSADSDDVVTSIRVAVARLVPPGSAHHVVLVTDAREPATPPDSPSNASRLVAIDALDCAASEEMKGFSLALVCPLVLDDRPTAGPSVGLLIVAADESVLLTLRGAIEVLASLAALAVERVTLSHEVVRRNNEAYFRTLVQNAHDVILIVDDEVRVRYASPSAEAVLGPGFVAGARFLDIVEPADGNVEELLTGAGADGVESGPHDYAVVRSDGGRIDVEVTARDLRDDPTVRGVVLTLRDVTEQRRLQEELTHRAFHDPLTGLANRVLFRDRVERALARAGRDGGVVGVLLIDMDDFKLVNDTMGHGAGDDLLAVVASRLTAVLRPDDTAARLGGDEFAILVEGAANATEVEKIAARVVDILSVPLDVVGGLTTSVSVGVATTTPGAHGPVAMLSQADLALYAAKGAGKGRWRRYEPGLHLAAVGRLAARTELERALATGAFALHYQPIVELGTGATVGVEALVRWHHPRRGLVTAAEFIHVAEETGLVVPLGAWVVEHAFADIARWRANGVLGPDRHLDIHVNVSACQIREAGFLAVVVDTLDRWDVPAESLVLEIAETALLTEDVQACADLAALRKLGVRIALDDFGTGHSSLDYLRLHTIDILKIDRSFVDGIESSGRQAALVGAIVHLARELGLRVVAEGVETPSQRDTLLLAGCGLGQGHLFSRPVPADELVHRMLVAPSHPAGQITAEQITAEQITAGPITTGPIT